MTSVAYSQPKGAIFAGCENGTLVSWSSVHGDLTGAFRTGIPGTVTKLALSSKDLLVTGTGFSLLMIQQVFEAGRIHIPARAAGKGNCFDALVIVQEAMMRERARAEAAAEGRTLPAEEEKGEERKEESMGLIKDQKESKETIESLDSS